MISLKNICKYYFQCFSDKNIEKLTELFADNIKLIDWNIQVEGKEKVLDANKNIFNNVDTIEVIPNNLYEDDNVVCCDINIIINQNEKIQVMDVIEFDDFMKIKSIRAYKM